MTAPLPRSPARLCRARTCCAVDVLSGTCHVTRPVPAHHITHAVRHRSSRIDVRRVGTVAAFRAAPVRCGGPRAPDAGSAGGQTRRTGFSGRTPSAVEPVAQGLRVAVLDQAEHAGRQVGAALAVDQQERGPSSQSRPGAAPAVSTAAQQTIAVTWSASSSRPRARAAGAGRAAAGPSPQTPSGAGRPGGRASRGQAR